METLIALPSRRCSRQSICEHVSIRSLSNCRGYGLRDVQESILVLVLVVDTAHKRSSRRQDLIDEDEDGLLWAELDSLANNIDELTNCQIGGDEVLLLVDCCNVGLLDFLTDDLEGC